MSSKFRKLLVWQRAMDLAVAVYGASEAFPRSEIFGLQSQVRRAASSVPSNIAEGDGRYRSPDQRRFFYTARGSLHEVETQLLIAERLAYITKERTAELLERVTDVLRLLNLLINQLSRDP